MMLMEHGNVVVTVLGVVAAIIISLMYRHFIEEGAHISIPHFCCDSEVQTMIYFGAVFSTSSAFMSYVLHPYKLHHA